MDFSSAAELLKICQASGIPLSQAMIDRETLYLGADTVTTYSRMEQSYEIMKNAVHSAVTEEDVYKRQVLPPGGVHLWFITIHAAPSISRWSIH